MKGNGNETIKCPFYKKHEGVVITCEGITDDSTLKLCFKSKIGQQKQQKIFCEKSYTNCEIYRTLLDKYDT